MNDRGHLSSHTLDAWLMGLLPAAERSEAEAHLSACSRCRQALEQQQKDHQKFNQEIFAKTWPTLRDKVTRKTGWRTWWGRWPVMIPVGVGAAAAVALVVFVFFIKPQASDEVRIKGDPTLQIFAKRPDREQVFAVTPEVKLRPGDRIRFVAEAPGRGFLLVVSKDRGGQVSFYVPTFGAQSVEIPPGKHEMPGSIELDQAPGPERIYAIFSDEPLSVATIADKMSQLPVGPLSKEQIPGAKTVVNLMFEKEVP
jgi:hypothetical protein